MLFFAENGGRVNVELRRVEQRGGIRDVVLRLVFVAAAVLQIEIACLLGVENIVSEAFGWLES